MKLAQIFGVVCLLHVVAIGVVLVQPGCKSMEGQLPPDPAMTEMGDEDTASEAPAPQILGAEPRERAQPLRPSQVADSALPPAFNAGLSLEDTEPLTPVAKSGAPKSSSSGQVTTYTVQPGDTISGIARKHGVTPAALLEANHLDKDDTIYPGDSLVIPEAGEPAKPAATANVSGGGIYEVQPGDSLSVIARRHGTDVATIKQLNNLSNDRILVGQKLRVSADAAPLAAPAVHVPTTPRPATNAAPAPAKQETARSLPASGQYEVKPGDTISGIASRFGVKSADLMQLNGITDPRKLQVGQTLNLPGSARAASSGAATAQQKPAAARPAAPQPVDTLDEPPALMVIPSNPVELERDVTLDELEALDVDAEGAPLIQVNEIE